MLLCGRNLLLAGEKATGKNVLAQNLAAVFERPAWDISFHVNMDAAALIGSDTFHDGRVTFRPGPVYCCAQSGGFGILDEINMARNEALAVLHSVLDFRRVIELQKKCENGELTEKALDLRGLIDAVSLIKKGIPIRDALDLGITNKIFDSYEKELIRDVIASRFPLKLHNTEVFE